MISVQLKGITLAILVLIIPSLLNAQSLTVERVASGLSQPLFATFAPGDTDRLFIIQRTGAIRILRLSTGNVTTFMTVPGVDTNFEGGLLGLAFHPDYPKTPYFYVNFTDWTGADMTKIRRYTRTSDDTADAGSEFEILQFSQPEQNHNGGWIGFSPIDRYLYIATGDGGGGNDQHGAIGNGQDITNNMLGKMLRIDVDGDDFPTDNAKNYANPPTNPFSGPTTGDDEIFLYGLRNPWRCSFDRDTGDLYIGDVGQNAREEIDFFPAAGHVDHNMGWRLREGTITTPGVGGPQPADGVNPIYDYPHSGPFGGVSVTGGYVYRGPIEALQGNYFFIDHNSNNFWSLRYDGSDPSTFDGTNYKALTRWNGNISVDVGAISTVAGMGEDADGNLYLCDRTGGEVFKIVDGQLFTDGTLDLVIPFVGTLESGSIDDLGDSDDVALTYRSAAVATGQPALQLEFRGTVPSTTPDTLLFNYEGRVTTPNLTQTIEIYNFLTSSYEEMDSQSAPTTDQMICIEMTDANVYTSVSGEVRTRVTWTVDGPVTGFPWATIMDQVGWQIID